MSTSNRQLLNQLKQPTQLSHLSSGRQFSRDKRAELRQTASRMDVGDFYGKYKTKVGYTLIVVSIAVFILHHAKPFIEDPNATSTQRQIYGMALVFLMTLLFNVVKNFVWSDSWKQQPAASTPAVEGKASDETAKKPASKGRRPPKA